MTTHGLPQVVILAPAISASFAADWAPGGNTYGAGSRPGSLAYRIGLSARCIHRAGLDGLRRIIDWEQGHSDSLNSTSEADYTSAMNKVIAECRNSGLLRPSTDTMFVHKSTALAATSGQRNAIRAAQAAVVDGAIVRAGADIDTLDASYRYDGIHFGPAGAEAQAELKRAVYTSVL